MPIPSLHLNKSQRTLLNKIIFTQIIRRQQKTTGLGCLSLFSISWIISPIPGLDNYVRYDCFKWKICQLLVNNMFVLTVTHKNMVRTTVHHHVMEILLKKN